ncbi:hypothetical protein CPC08DRAFT_317580 [Agrocybe pediades]|nr:hypothetical protein CPC08DRAFT_317580 [Agrocybe pediades]
MGWIPRGISPPTLSPQCPSKSLSIRMTKNSTLSAKLSPKLLDILMSIRRSAEVSVGCDGEVGGIVGKGAHSNNSHAFRLAFGIENYVHEMETYIKEMEGISGRWRRTDLDSCGSDNMLWLLPYKYHHAQ